jgi:hypothetical protein
MLSTCSVCHNEKDVHIDRKTKKPVCKNCHINDPSKLEICSACNNLRRVEMRTKTGKPLCPACCNRLRLGFCGNCGELKPIQAFNLCWRCYKNHRTALRLASCSV